MTGGVALPDATPDFRSEIAALGSLSDIRNYLTRMTLTYGFAFFFVGAVPSVEDENLSSIAILTNLPPDLQESYDSAGLLQRSAGFERLRTMTTPFQMSVDDWVSSTSNPQAGQHGLELTGKNIRQVHYFPVHDADGSRAIVIFSGPQVDLPISRVMELQMVVIHLYNRLTELGPFWKDEDVSLTERELQCLTWTAAGKTSAEIAGILGLSEHTVNHYLNHVTKKLNAVNRMQAVVKAMRKGLIS